MPRKKTVPIEDQATDPKLTGQPPVEEFPPLDGPPADEGLAAEDSAMPEEGEPEVVEVDLDAPTEGPDAAEGSEAPAREDAAPPPKAMGRTRRSVSERQQFFGLDFHELDRDLTTEERQEWNSIYASYRGRSALSGVIIGVDKHTISIRDPQSGDMERHAMYCAIVIPYRVRIVIPASEMWEPGQERPDFVLQNMVGATIDFIIVKVDRESGFAIASRRLASRARRRYFSNRPALNRSGSRLKCRVMSVGPRRCLVECYGHDINMTQRELRYTAIPDLRNEYHPGQELECIVKDYDKEKETLTISVKETESNPYEGAELRHPAGSRRHAVISGKYGGGVFCNLPDGTVCMCNYSYQYTDAEFTVGDSVIVLIQRFDDSKKQIYGKIITKW